MNGVIFSNQLSFNIYDWASYKHTDKRDGCSVHYLALLVSGTARITTDSTVLTLAEGDIFYIPCGLRYQSFWYGEPRVKLISLAFSVMPERNTEVFGLQRIDCTEEVRDTFFDLAQRECIDCGTIGRFYCLLHKVLPCLKCGTESRSASIVSKAKKMVSEDPFIPVTELTRRLTVSESGLYLAFSRHSESTLNTYRSNVLMEMARELLASTDTPVERISAELRFSSSSYFRKCFKQHFGMTPRQMRQSLGV